VDESSQSPPGLRILAAVVNDDAALDGCSVVVINVNFARAASESVDGQSIALGFASGRCKRRFYTRRLKCDPRALEFLR
jgi:hypothetical protein